MKQLLLLIGIFLGLFCSAQGRYDVVRIGLCSDVHIPTMHDANFRLSTFMDQMKAEKPDFIIELGDFAQASEKFDAYYKLWDSFPGDKYHVIGNHEMDGGHSREEAIAYRNMERSYYSFDKKGFHFIVLDGNDKKDENAKGYKQFIGPSQIEWFKNDLADTKYPVVIFSHQGLVVYHGVDEDYSIENAEQVQRIIGDHNASHPGKRVIACFNGHTHWDYAEKINGVWYIHITSMSYHWLGEGYERVRFSNEVDRDFKWIKYTAPFKDPLFTTVEISSKGFIKIAGKTTEWVGPSPFEIGYPEQMKRYMRPAISKRTLKFKL
ncbi:MAG: metallophosphoesterase family protein [Mangrovibacterium sp.]